MKSIILGVVAAVLTGCAATSRVASNRNANAYSGRIEGEQSPRSTEGDRERLARLFSDKPEYAALALRNDTDATKPRALTTLAPEYPSGFKFSDAKALIRIAVVVSEKGTVEEARAYDTSDARFSHEALEAVRDWNFHPGVRNGAHAKFIQIVPIHFDGRQK